MGGRYGNKPALTLEQMQLVRILAVLRDQLTNVALARALNVSPKTVGNAINAIHTKTHAAQRRKARAR